MIKLMQKKIDWIIKEKKKGKSTSEMAKRCASKYKRSDI